MTGRKYLAIVISVLVLIQGAAGAVLAMESLCVCPSAPRALAKIEAQTAMNRMDGRIGGGESSCCQTRQASMEKSRPPQCCETLKPRVETQFPCKFCGSDQCQCSYSDRSGQFELVYTTGNQVNLETISLIPLSERDNRPLFLILGPDPVRVGFQSHGPPLFLCKSSFLI